MCKTILILDKKPKYCSDCPLNQKVTSFLHGTRYICGKTGRYNDSINNAPFAPKWCPLKELPAKKDTISQINLAKEAEENHVKVDAQAGFNLGWNACLDEIDGSKQEQLFEFPIKLGDHIWRIIKDENGALMCVESVVNGFNIMYDGAKFATIGGDEIHPSEAVNLSLWGITLFKTPGEAKEKICSMEDKNDESESN